MNIPKERYICKYYWYCQCNENDTGKAYCYADIHDLVDVNQDCCCDFDYDDTFTRT